MEHETLTVLVLAAGEGTRMRSVHAKVLHHVAGKSLLAYVLSAAEASGAEKIGVVIGPGRDDVRAEVLSQCAHAQLFVQTDRRGTGHAVLQARPLLETSKSAVIIAFGDTPLLRASTFKTLAAALQKGADVVIGAFETATPTGYGRLVYEGNKVAAIVEEKDTSAAQKKLTLVNGGVMALNARYALPLIEAIDSKNAAQEFYLTDVVKLAHARGLNVDVVQIEEQETLGINTRAQLADAEQLMQRRLRHQVMMNGVTLVAPDSVFLSHDTQLAQDVVIHPHVVLGVGVSVESGVEIFSFSHLAGVAVKDGARIGPFARLRPGSEIGAEAHIGNFVEINRSTIAAHVDINHLSYIGDADIGAHTNIGAGTITCNFDGGSKHATQIGSDVFVGSNSTLVAPVSIGDKSLIAAGSVVTKDIESGAMVFGRVKDQVALAGKGAQKIDANKAVRAARKAKAK